jgi:hypothetical protein
MDKHGFQLTDSFDSKIRFSSEQTAKYLQMAGDNDEKIIRSYDIEENQGQVLITEQIVNLML